jgi:competence protein ComEA
MPPPPPSPGAPADAPPVPPPDASLRAAGLEDQGAAGLEVLRRLVAPPGPSARSALGDRVAQRLAAIGLPAARGRVLGLALAAVAVVAIAAGLARALPMASRGGSRSAGTTADVPRQVLDDAGGATTTAGAAAWAAIAGAVARPGLYPIGPDIRVSTLIGLAGGLTPDADPDRINLAAPVRDGERVYVPRRGDLGAPPVIAGGSPGGTGGAPAPVGRSGSGSGSGGGGSGAAGSGSPARPVDLNTAPAEELDRLPGVGPATATAIIQYRSAHGPFASVEDLASVRGIGPAKLEQLRDLVTV